MSSTNPKPLSAILPLVGKTRIGVVRIEKVTVENKTGTDFKAVAVYDAANRSISVVLMGSE